MEPEVSTPAEQILIFDTTLRDGEQSPGCSMHTDEKLLIAHQLERLGVDIIEAGFPIASQGDFEAVQRIAAEVRQPRIAALARCVHKDIEIAAKALEGAARPRIHTFLATSDIHLAFKLKLSRQDALQTARECVAYARSLCDDIEFSPEDATRSEPAFLCEVLQSAVDSGATTLNIPDTVGYTMPDEYSRLIRQIRDTVRGEFVISAHCHNDLGMAVANSLAAISAGARQVECTINGIGERAGNAALEEVVMGLRTRADYYGLTTGIEPKELFRTSRMVADMLGMPVPPNKAVIGTNAFAHSSGIHVDGFLKNRQTYEIMTPADVGFTESRVVLTARTGRAGLRSRLEKLGYELTKAELETLYTRFLTVADKKQEVLDEDLAALVHDELPPLEHHLKLEYLHTYSGTAAIPTATVRLLVKGKMREGASIGDGPVDAAYKAISAVTGSKAKLLRYDIRAITGGTEAMGEVTVHVELNGHRAMGRGASTDIIEASAKAYVDGLNRLGSA
jgi:2-isopropylmalate synthase